MPPKDDNASQSDMDTFVGYDFRRITFLDIMRSDECTCFSYWSILIFYDGLISKHVVGKDKKYICSIM